jgi:O-antigen/teichoic acid export membrane protein
MAVPQVEDEPPPRPRLVAVEPPPPPQPPAPPPRAVVPGARHFVRTVIKFGVAQPLTWASSAALAILLPHFLGASNLGKLGFAFGLTLITGQLANLGVSVYLTKEVARAPERAGTLAASALAMRIPLSAGAALVAVAIVSVGSHGDLTRTVVLVLSVAILLDAVRAVVQGTLQGLHRMTTLAAFPAITGAVYAIGAAFALTRGAGVVAVAVAYIAGQTAGLAVSAVSLWRALPHLPGPTWRICRMLLIGGLPFFVWQAALAVYGQVDSVILSYLTNDAVVGWYVAAYRIVTLPIFVPTVLMTVAFPALSAAVRDPERFNAITRRAIQVVLLTTTPMALGIMLLPDRIVHALHWSDTFQHSILPIVLLAPSFPLVAVDMMIGTALTARDRQKQWALTGVAAAVLNPTLNLILIPYTQTHYGNGAIGASIVTTVTELFMMVVGLILMPRGVLVRETAAWTVRCLGACLVMAILVVLLRGATIFFPVVIGALAYVAASVSFGTLSLSDVRGALRHVVSRAESAA